MLEDNAEETYKGKYHRQFTTEERNQRKTRNSDIDIDLEVIDEEFNQIKQEFKAKRQPLVDEKKRILAEIKANGEYVEGRLHKIIDWDAKEVGIYDDEGNLTEQRRLTAADKQTKLRFENTGTND